MHKYLKSFFLSAIFLTTHLFALQEIKININSNNVNLLESSEIFIDAQNHFSYEAVSADSFSDNFQPINAKSISMSSVKDTLWMRFKISNEQDSSFVGQIEMPTPWTQKVDAYIASSETLSSFSYIDSSSFFIPLSIAPMQSVNVYIKVKSQNPLLLAPTLQLQKSADERLSQTTLFNGFLIGIVLIMILYNFINYLVLKNSSYLYYGLYLFGLLFLMGTYYGYNTNFFLKYADIAPFSISFSLFGALLFVRSFVDTKENFPKIDKFIIGFVLFALLISIISLIITSSSAIIYPFALFASVVFLSLIFISAIALKKGITGSIYLLSGWILLALGELVAFLMTFGLFSYNEYMYSFFALMVIANILMIGSALIIRTKDNETKYELEVEKEHELSDKLNLSKKELKELSEKLQRKISKLESELAETNKKSVSVKDELTGLYMRAKHEEMLTNELYRTKRHSYTFSIIVINIDNLKNINEKHGHEVGNSLIKEMGDLFMRNVRFVDTVGRWSDTEYLILCPQTAVEDALSTANKLKGLVQKSKFFFIGTATASFGVASSRGDDTINDILRRGYTALSLAKENGKNRAEMSA